MYAVEIRFPAGRYHATGWDHHVNEGTVEWPPSPLRLLRALVATGFKLGWAPERVRTAVTALRGLPVYRLPPVTAGHTRHYMPTDAKRVLVFDAFYAIAHGDVLVAGWPEASVEDVRGDLDALWTELQYLGRAESWVECVPITELGEPDALPGFGGVEQVTLLALETDEALASWLTTQPRAGSRGPWVPRDAWDVLLSDVGVVQRSGWSRPPGIREVSYGLRRAAVVAPLRRGVRRPEPAIRSVVFALSSAVMPDVTRTVSVADRVRRAVMSRTTWLDDAGQPIGDRRPDTDLGITGKDADGRPLLGHAHARWLPFASARDGRRLDRLLVVVRDPGGFSPRALEALRSLRKVWGDDQHDLHLVLLGIGDDAVAPEAADLLRCSRVWVTDTPFVPQRYPKGTKDGIADQVRRALAQQEFPAPRSVEPLTEGAHGIPWHAFGTWREGGGVRARLRGVGVRLVFDEPVPGPIALGWGGYFGMGRFRAEDADVR